ADALDRPIGAGCAAQRARDTAHVKAALRYPIITSRLRLRPLTVHDVDDLVAYRSREDVCRWVPFTPMDAAAVLRRLQENWSREQLTDEGQSLTLGVELPNSGGNPATDAGTVIGDVVLFWHSRQHAAGEVGYVFHPDY